MGEEQPTVKTNGVHTPTKDPATPKASKEVSPSARAQPPANGHTVSAIKLEPANAVGTPTMNHKENHRPSAPTAPVVAPPSATVENNSNYSVDQILLKVISTCMEMRQMYLTEHEHKADAESKLDQLKKQLTSQAMHVRDEEEKMVKYFFDAIMGEEYHIRVSESVPESQSMLIAPLKDALALVEKYKPTAPTPSSKYMATPVDASSAKTRAETLCANLRAYTRQLNLETFPQAVAEVSVQKQELQSQVDILAKSISDLQTQMTAIRQKYQYLTSNEPLQCLNQPELEMLETLIRRESENILNNIATSIYCIVCQVNMRVIALLPCGHLYYCEECANKITECAQCRTPIQYRAYIKR